MPRGVKGVPGSVTEQLSRFQAQRSQLEAEEKKVRDTLRSALAARLMKQLGGTDDDLAALEQLVMALERSGLAAIAEATSQLPERTPKGRGRGKDEGSGEKETGVDA